MHSDERQEKEISKKEKGLIKQKSDILMSDSPCDVAAWKIMLQSVVHNSEFENQTSSTSNNRTEKRKKKQVQKFVTCTCPAN